VAVIAVSAARLASPGRAVRVLATAAVGMALPALLASLLLVRSGLPPVPWSGYDFWFPERFADLSDAFDPRSALESREGVGRAGAPLSNLQLGARVLLGLPGIRRAHDPGAFWPLLGWVACVALWRAARERGPTVASHATAAVGALAAWALAHLAVFSPYAYSGGRFYLPVLMVLATAFGAGLGLAVARAGGSRRRLAAAAICVLAVPLLLPWSLPRLVPSRYAPPPFERAVGNRVARWLALPDEIRARRVVPFDPVFAQALGLLPPSALARVRHWGRLPPTWHVRRLVDLGRLDGAEVAPAGPRGPRPAAEP
jgi:hypothetical protein